MEARHQPRLPEVPKVEVEAGELVVAGLGVAEERTEDVAGEPEAGL